MPNGINHVSRDSTGRGGGEEKILKMLNRGINGRPLIKIIPACFDRSNEKHWPSRCRQTTGKICPLSLQTFCTGRRYTWNTALEEGEKLAKETRILLDEKSSRCFFVASIDPFLTFNLHGSPSPHRRFPSASSRWRDYRANSDLYFCYSALSCSDEGGFYLIWQETFVPFSI